MRSSLMVLPLLLCAAPAFAQAAPPAPAQPAASEVQRVLNDPAVVDRLANTMQAMSRAFLNMPVGELQAAVEGRPATRADRQRRLRDIDPKVDRDLEGTMAQARPMIRQSMRALSDA